MNQGAVSFIENMFFASDFKKGEDYEVVSFMVLDHQYNFHSIDHFFEINSHELFSLHQIGPKSVNHFFQNHPKVCDVISLSETPFPQNEYYPTYFYKLKGLVHFDYAISVGLGVIRMLQGTHKGEYLLYNFLNQVEDEQDVQNEPIDEMLRLKIYSQLTYPRECDDKRLEKLMREDPIYLSLLLPGDSKRVLNKLEYIYQSKKGQILPFRRKEKRGDGSVFANGRTVPAFPMVKGNA